MDSRPPVEFFFDFLSPYAYLAWTRVHDVCARRGREVAPVPVLFAALLNHHGQKGPAEIAPKRLYVFKNALRTAHGLGIPFGPPPSHPFNPLLALRASSLPLPAAARKALIDALFVGAWGGGGGIERPEQVAQAARRAGLDGDAIVASAGDEASKARLRSETERAIAAGVFGVPTMIADGELFWGYDALPHLDQFLRGEDPVQKVDLSAWSYLPSSASR